MRQAANYIYNADHGLPIVEREKVPIKFNILFLFTYLSYTMLRLIPRKDSVSSALEGGLATVQGC